MMAPVRVPDRRGEGCPPRPYQAQRKVENT